MWGVKGAIFWCGILAILCGLSWVQVTRHWHLQTDVLALLPKSEQDPAMQSLRQLVSGTLGRTALILVGHHQGRIANEATRQLSTWMEASPLVNNVQWDYSRQQQSFFELYFPLRYRMLSPTIRQALATPSGYQTLIQRLQHTLYQPTSSFATQFLDDDPLLLFPALAQSWGQSTQQLRLDEGLLTRTHEGRAYRMITAQLAFNPFDTQGQTQFETQWQQWTHALHQTWPDLQLTTTSVARFAAATRHTIHQDILLISVGSLLGVLVLTLSTFRTIRHLLLALLPITAGIWCALGICLWIFGELHALTLTFGASLIGICIDYSFHYFAHHRVTAPWRATTVMRHLVPALGLGAFTTILSYMGLALTPLVGLQQIAIFASCGIVISFGTVVLVFPCLLQAEHAQAQRYPRLYHVAARYVSMWQHHSKWLLAICALGLAACVPGLLSLRIIDTPQALNALPPDLTQQDRFIRQLMGLPAEQTHLIITRPTAEDALQTLERVYTALAATSQASSNVQFGPILTTFLPSQRQQEKDRQTVHQLLRHQAELTDAFNQLGFTPDMIDRLFQSLQQDSNSPLTPDEWLQHDASMGLRHLWLGKTGYGTSLLVPLLSVTNLQQLKDQIAPIAGVQYVDQISDFTHTLRRYRRQAVRLAGGAYGLIFILLLWRYGKRGILLILPPLLAALVTVSCLGLLGYPFHLIHCLALLLILGMGVDYTIFIAESASDAGPTTLLALTLSALTTLLSFGLLSFSSQAVLQAIGLTTLIGIAVALLLAPLAQYGQPTS